MNSILTSVAKNIGTKLFLTYFSHYAPEVIPQCENCLAWMDWVGEWQCPHCLHIALPHRVPDIAELYATPGPPTDLR
jgi:hypothetical protein